MSTESPSDSVFLDFRRKVRDLDLLSTTTQRLLQTLKFTGRVCVIVQNGRILKSGYEEGYFSRRTDDRLI